MRCSSTASTARSGAPRATTARTTGSPGKGGNDTMKTRNVLAAALLASASVPAAAQEHWTEGPVWECTSYRTNPGMFDTYIKYIRANAIPVYEEMKKAGL